MVFCICLRSNGNYALEREFIMKSFEEVFTAEELKRVWKLAEANAKKAPKYSKKGKAELARLLS